MVRAVVVTPPCYPPRMLRPGQCYRWVGGYRPELVRIIRHGAYDGLWDVRPLEGGNLFTVSQDDLRGWGVVYVPPMEEG